MHIAPFRLLFLVGVGACFTDYCDLTTNFALLAGVMIIVLHLAYPIHARQGLMSR